MNKIHIAEYVINYRKEHKLSQGEFGALLGVSAFAVSKWEREVCYPDIFLLPDLSKLLGISVDEMLGVHASSISNTVTEGTEAIEENETVTVDGIVALFAKD